MAYTSGNDVREAVSEYLEGGLADLSEEEVEVLAAFATSVLADIANPGKGEDGREGEEDEDEGGEAG